MSLISTNNTLMLKGIVTCTPDKDPMGAGRYQVYIPSIHGKLDSGRVASGTQANNNSTISYPWAEYLAYTDTTPTVGTYVLIGLQGNDYNSMVILGKYGNIESSSSSIMSSVTGGTLAELAAQVIFGNEGNYESVNWNDNGAISIGKIQWHANRARNLLKLIRSKNESNFDSIASGTSITSDLSSDWSNWKNYTSGSPTGKALKSILATNESHTAQDEQAIEDVKGYISTAEAGGITDPKCLIYIADIINQYGSCSSLISQKINDLDKLHQYALSNGYGTYATRRINTYNKIKELEMQGKFTVNVLSTEGVATAGNGSVGWPIPSVAVGSSITSPFGMRVHPIKKVRKLHNGIDIGVPNGTNIHSAQDGQVIVNKSNPSGYGWYVVIKNDSFVTLYAHMREQSKLGVGTMVSRGTFVGHVGSTGSSTGNHLHFTVGKSSAYKDVSSLNSESCAIDPTTVI